LYDLFLRYIHLEMIDTDVKIAMKACPYRVDFYKKLGDDKDKVEKQMIAWLDALERIVSDMTRVYSTEKYGQI
jgi:hypothetical protein